RAGLAGGSRGGTAGQVKPLGKTISGLTRYNKEVISEIVRSQYCSCTDLPQKNAAISFRSLWCGSVAVDRRIRYRKREQAKLKMAKLKCVLCWLCLYSLLTIIAFGVEAADTAVGQEKPAEPAVKALNNAVPSKLPFNKQDDFQDAARGL